MQANSSSAEILTSDEETDLNEKIANGKKLIHEAQSLHDLPLEWKSTTTLKSMKASAQRANCSSQLQDVRRKADMAQYLEEKVLEAKEFVTTIRGFTFSDYVEMGVANLGVYPTKKRRRLRKDDDVESLVQSAMEAAIHIVPSGSGVHLGRGLILTCAHCVIHDDVDDTTDTTKEKIGRVVEILSTRGQAFGSVCIAACIETDLAVLQIEDSSTRNNPHPLGSLSVGSQGSDSNGTDIFAIGNPCDEDLEIDPTCARRSNGYFPFHLSKGKLVKKISKKKATELGVGQQIHSCWTYWGHSGCPLLNKDGEGTPFIVGLHNSWDDRNGNRHGVALDEIIRFISDLNIITTN